MSQATEWEYRVGSYGGSLRGPKDEELEQVLNEWGEQGWEVVSVLPRESSNRVTLVARRPLSVAARRERRLAERGW